jgi:hypothetical protein
VDPTGSRYAFEKGVDTADGKRGWADVWLKGKFGREHLGRYKDRNLVSREATQGIRALLCSYRSR